MRIEEKFRSEGGTVFFKYSCWVLRPLPLTLCGSSFAPRRKGFVVAFFLPVPKVAPYPYLFVLRVDLYLYALRELNDGGTCVVIRLASFERHRGFPIFLGVKKGPTISPVARKCSPWFPNCLECISDKYLKWLIN